MSRIRLVCPNCGAQYEVPLNVIPDAGRDVQCSSCAHTWFQRHPDQDQALAEELEQPVEDVAWEQALEEEPAPAEPAHRDTPAPRDATEPQPPPAPRRTFDPELTDMFREEREFEARQRAAQALETQPDLGLQSPDEDERARRDRQSRERMARLRGSAPEPAPAPTFDEAAVPTLGTAPEPEQPSVPEHEAAAAAAAAVGSRRDLLPDVEEINQTLRSDADPRPQDFPGDGLPPQETPRQGGFGKGFLSMIVLAGLGIGTYAYAPKLSQSVPAIAPYLDVYVSKVDAGRIWLDGQITALLQQLDSMASENQTAPSNATAPDSDD